MAWELTGNIKGDPGVVSDEILGDLFWASRRPSEPDPELTLTLGAAATVITQAQRTTLGLGFFPDGTAQFRYQPGVGFIGQASNGANTAVWGAADPAAAFVDSVYAAAVVMGNTPAGANYGSGGPALAGVLGEGVSYFVSHMERTILGSQHYTHLALTSLDASLNANYLWPMVEANIQDDDPVFVTNPNLDMGSGPTAAPGDGYTYLFYKDRMAGALGSQHMSMARCLISDIEAWQDGGPVPQYKKWNGPELRWSEPGIGGEAVDLFDDINGYLAWMDVIWLEQAQRWACIYSYDNYNTAENADYALGIKFCADLANPIWTDHQDLIPSDGTTTEKAFVTVSAPFVTDGSYDQRSIPGNTFHVFRTIAPTILDGNRWDDAYVERRTVTISTDVPVLRSDTDLAGAGFIDTDAFPFRAARAYAGKVPTNQQMRGTLLTMIPAFAAKANDEAVVNNSTVLTNVADLTLTVPALARYRFHAWLHLVGDAAADARLRVNGTGGFGGGGFALLAPATAYTSSASTLFHPVHRSFNTDITGIGVIAGSGIIWELSGWFVTGFSEGVIQIQVAQNVATVGALTVKAHSFMSATPSVVIALA